MLLVAVLLISATAVYGQTGKCDQTPVEAKVLTPSDNENSPFTMNIKTKIETDNTNYGMFLPDQTYVLILETKDNTRPFREFMITVEDPEVDNDINFEHSKVDVGTLKTLDEDFKSRYSERCYSSVENKDNSDKRRIEMHWVSPKQSEDGQKIRFRAMVAENKEVWYTGDALTFTLEKNNAIPEGTPPAKPVEICKLCSEARYEVIFNGKWSRGTHNLHFPSKPDDIKYSHMIGASHDFTYTLWEQGVKASDGLRQLAEEANISKLERDVILNMSETGGTRTLIRGKMHQHPHMSEPSYALFRVDRIHHLFSIAVALKPSPDWFLGTSRFELCTEEGWLESHQLPMYPYDAGTRDGISYDSITTMTQPADNVERVAVGSFDKASPFYQMNLNDLKPFAILEVRRLDVYPLVGVDCEDNGEEPKRKRIKGSGRKYNRGKGTADEEEEKHEDVEEENDEPLLAESKTRDGCTGEWSRWSTCIADDRICGAGTQTRTRYIPIDTSDQPGYESEVLQVKPLENCQKDQQIQQCFVNCY
ncbi:spondin-2-like [Pectinophora gossypiella]|uniref:spondin-2-like n=1 Tax=Pectinophora gossypiella TaxID=13191 RepID=UPI00214EA4BA|nr:spondin-2-like [Pectinophora gossypiella]